MYISVKIKVILLMCHLIHMKAYVPTLTLNIYLVKSMRFCELVDLLVSVEAIKKPTL